MAIQLNTGLAGMLTKLLGKPEGKTEAGVATHALKEGADPQQALKKGTPLGDGTVLAGAGYNPKDRAVNGKNAHEVENLQRFLQDPEGAKLPKKEDAAKSGDDKEARAAKETADRSEAKETKEAQKAEVRKDERAEDVKQHQLRDTKQEEAREERGHHEHDRHKDDKQKDDERDRQSRGYYLEEPAPEQEEAKHQGQYDRDALGETLRCYGTAEDGTRCLRKPVAGTSYCREHYAGSGGAADPITGI
ncbi:MAG: hypothetical protein U1E65_31365 [Myxococcota bacterium]